MAVEDDIAALRLVIADHRRRIAALEAKPTTPPAVADDPPGTWRKGAGASVRFAGHVWSITSSGALARNGAASIETSQTRNVTGLGVIDGPRLAHDGGGQRWGFVAGQASWNHLGPSPDVTQAATPTVPAAPYTPAKPPGEVRQWIRTSSAGPFTVPADFVGMHLHRYPNLAAWERQAGRVATPRPAYGYGARRTWDYAEATAWCAVAGRSGTERNWSLLDELVATEAAAGRSLMVTINGTPNALSSNPSGPGQYVRGWPGCNYAPRDAAAFEALRKYVAELVARYGSKVAWIDTNNEPDPENPIPDAKNFWVGTRAQHAEWHRMIRLAVPRGTGPKLVGPSQVFWNLEQGKAHPYALSVLQARDSAGTRLLDHLDAYGWHYYMPPDADPFEYWQAITAIRATLLAAGAPPDFPIIDTEHGKLNDTDTDPTAFARRVQRDLAIAAGAGLAAVYLYSGDGPNLQNPSAGGPVGPAVDAAHKALPGMQIREAAILTDGRVWLAGAKGGQPAQLVY